MKILALRLLPGDDLRASLEDYTRTHALEAAFVLSAVGSLRSALLRYADADHAQPVPGPLEIVSLVGTLSQTGAHLHIAVADTQGKVSGGHLGVGSLVHTTAEIVIGATDALRFTRAPDPATGYHELVIKPGSQV